MKPKVDSSMQEPYPLSTKLTSLNGHRHQYAIPTHCSSSYAGTSSIVISTDAGCTSACACSCAGGCGSGSASGSGCSCECRCRCECSCHRQTSAYALSPSCPIRPPLPTPSTSPSMTVINLPQQQRFQLYQQRQLQKQPQVDAEHIHPKSNAIQIQDIRFSKPALRRSNETKNLASKKRVVKMLLVLVLEFFICWTPLYIINTVAMFIGPVLYDYIDYTSISVLQLLAYSSSCCNPITYCFMNAGFRRAFLDTFRSGGRSGRKKPKLVTNLSGGANSGVTMTTILDSPRVG